MELFLILAFWGMCIAVSEGTKAGGRALVKTYRSKLSAASKSHPRSAKAGLALGAAAGALTTGGLLMAGETAKGAKAGWGKGRQQARDWHERRTNRQDEPAPATEPKPAAKPEPKPEPAPKPAAEAKPLRLVTDPPPTASSNGGKRMAVMTATGGEVQTMDQLLAELKAIEQQATAELEDAKADDTRAKELLQQIETMVASAASAELDSQSLGEVGALRDPTAQKQKAAETRAAAAEHLRALAGRAAQGVQKRHQLMQEAHRATAEPAKKEFYAG